MITVEDGTGVPNANSYVTLLDAIEFAENLGSPQPDLTEAELIRGMREVHKYAFRFSGERTHIAQSELADWPRTGATYYGATGVIAEDEIPACVIQAQVLAAVDIHNGLVISGTTGGKSIASERVDGAVAVSYFNNGSTGNGGQRSEATLEMLQPVLSDTTSQSGGGSGFGLPLRR